METWIILGIVAVIIVVYILVPNTAAYLCPKCGKTFVPKKTQLLGMHSFGKHMLKCPYCGSSCMMGPAKEQK